MARLEKPLFSDQATGNIANTLSYINPSKNNQYNEFRRYPHVRHSFHRTPKRTPPQDAQRQLFYQAKQAWNSLSPDQKKSWNLSAPPPLNGYNFFLQCYLLNLPLQPTLFYIFRELQPPQAFSSTTLTLEPKIFSAVIPNPYVLYDSIIYSQIYHSFPPPTFSPNIMIYIPYLYPLLRIQIRSSPFPSLTPGLDIAIYLVYHIIVSTPAQPQTQILTRPHIEVSTPQLNSEVIQK